MGAPYFPKIHDHKTQAKFVLIFLHTLFPTLHFYSLCCLCLFIYSFSIFPGFLSNPYFLRQYPMLPGILRAIPRVVRGWGGGYPCMDTSLLQPCAR